MTRTIEEIEKELEEARAIQEAERQLKRDAVKPIWEYTVTPSARQDLTWDPIYDKTIRAYDLVGRVTNEDECKAAGHPDFALRGGGMRYLFNTGTGRLIGPTGGGTIYLSTGWGMGKRSDKDLEVAVTAISQFLVDHPKGGDITEIITKFRKATGDE
jgi:hypothetical protein